jgi:hypothetical protein
MIGSINLALRFLLEVTALVALGYWGYQRFDSPLRFGVMLAVPAVYATLWAVFRVSGDPGDAPVAIPGIARLALEFVVFASAVLALSASGQRGFALMLAVVVAGHYAIDYERVLRLMRQ